MVQEHDEAGVARPILIPDSTRSFTYCVWPTYSESPFALQAIYSVRECRGENDEKYGVKPLGRIVTGAAAGVPPRVMGLGPVPSTKKCLERAGLSLRH